MMKTLRTIILTVCMALFVVSGGALEPSDSLPVKCGYVVVPNGRLYYEECGEGVPLLLLHGHTLDTRMWDGQFALFARHYRTVRFDFRGYGRSSKQTEDFAFTHLGDLLTLMDSLRIDKAHIVGLSMGGFVTADMLGVCPERMLSAVMANGNIRMSPGPGEPMTIAEAARRDSFIVAVRNEGLEAYKHRWIEGLISSGGSRAESIREPLLRMVSDWDGWQALHKEVRVIVGRDAWQMLQDKHPEVPSLVIESHAKLSKKLRAPKILQCLPQGRWVLIEDAGHMVNMERPKQFNETVLDFLSAVDSR